MTKAGHGVQSEGEKIIADRLYDCGIDYIYDSLIEIDGEWIRPDFILPGLNDLIIEYKGMDDFEYHENFQFSGRQKSSIFFAMRNLRGSCRYWQQRGCE